MRALRKGLAGAFNITRDICGEARLAERAFEIAAFSLSELVQFLTHRLERQANTNLFITLTSSCLPWRWRLQWNPNTKFRNWRFSDQ